jgi:hypothetical protein
MKPTWRVPGDITDFEWPSGQAGTIVRCLLDAANGGQRATCVE